MFVTIAITAYAALGVFGLGAAAYTVWDNVR